MKIKSTSFFKILAITTISCILSFALAISSSAELISYNDNYGGIYRSFDNSEAFISISSSSITVFAYYDDTKKCHVRGSTSVGSITATSFYAYFDTIRRCYSDGTYYAVYEKDFTAQGDVNIGFILWVTDYIDIEPDNNDGEIYRNDK